jgi:hypothetical protein
LILKFHFRGQRTNRLPKWVRIIFKINNETLLTKINNEKPNFFHEFDSSKLKDENIKQEKLKRSRTYKIFVLLRNDLQRKKAIETKTHLFDLFLIEWKELARKVENIFFIVTFLIIFILPTSLFNEYLFEDLSTDISLQKNCRCELI